MNIHPTDDLYQLLAHAEKVGYDGKFAFLAGHNEDGRPIIIAIGVGDGCAELHQAIRTRCTTEQTDL